MPVLLCTVPMLFDRVPALFSIVPQLFSIVSPAPIETVLPLGLSVNCSAHTVIGSASAAAADDIIMGTADILTYVRKEIYLF